MDRSTLETRHAKAWERIDGDRTILHLDDGSTLRIDGALRCQPSTAEIEETRSARAQDTLSGSFGELVMLSLLNWDNVTMFVGEQTANGWVWHAAAASELEARRRLWENRAGELEREVETLGARNRELAGQLPGKWVRIRLARALRSVRKLLTDPDAEQ